MGRTNALERFEAGQAPPDWERDPSVDHIVFCRTDCGLCLRARPIDVDAREPGLDVCGWEIEFERVLGEATVTETVDRAADRASAVRALYDWMDRIGSVLCDAGVDAPIVWTTAAPNTHAVATGDR